MLIIYKVVVKEAEVGAFKQLAADTLVPEARKQSGCELFSLYQNSENEREFIFHEEWDSEASVHAYKQRLVALLGAPHPGEEFPAAMNDMIETDADLV